MAYPKPQNAIASWDIDKSLAQVFYQNNSKTRPRETQL